MGRRTAVVLSRAVPADAGIPGCGSGEKAGVRAGHGLGPKDSARRSVSRGYSLFNHAGTGGVGKSRGGERAVRNFVRTFAKGVRRRACNANPEGISRVDWRL